MKYELRDCLGLRLGRLSRKVDGIYRKYLEGADITERQLTIIFTLSLTGKIEQIELGRILNLERSSLSRNLQRLINQGFIMKEGAVNRPMISLTKKGLKKVKSVLPAWELAMDEIHCLLNEKSLAGFSNFESKLLEI